MHLHEGERARRVSAEHRDRTVTCTCGVNVFSVHADRHRLDAVKPVNPSEAVLVYLHECEDARSRSCIPKYYVGLPSPSYSSSRRLRRADHEVGAVVVIHVADSQADSRTVVSRDAVVDAVCRYGDVDEGL